MSPIRKFFSDDSKHKAILAAFWAVIFICVVISSVSIFIASDATSTAKKATATADRSEDGFCIAVKLIEDGAVSDAAIANSPGVSPDVRRIRTGQYKASLAFALKLRHLGFRCPPPSPAVINLVRKVNP